MKRKPGLGAAEAEILAHVAQKQPITVRDTAAFFASKRGVTKTTILNVMERLRDKGFLNRELHDGVFHYSATQSQADVLRGQVADFIDSMLGGSLEPFAAYLGEKETITDAELSRLKEIIQKLEEKR